MRKLAEQCQKSELKTLGGPICDGIIYPRCLLLFGENIKEHDAKLAIFLKSHYIPVRSVGNTATNDSKVAFVYLLDSDNQFTKHLVQNLDNSLEDISTQIKLKIAPSEFRDQLVEAELKNVYIRQSDFTRDFLGFLIVQSLLTHNFDILR